MGQDKRRCRHVAIEQFSRFGSSLMNEYVGTSAGLDPTLQEVGPVVSNPTDQSRTRRLRLDGPSHYSCDRDLLEPSVVISEILVKRALLG